MQNRLASALVIALAAASAGTAFAESPTPEPQAVASSRTRADVQAEFAQFKAAGVNPWSTSYNPLRGFKSDVSRQQVTADYLASRDEVAAIHAEHGGANFQAARSVRPAGSQTAGTPNRAL